MDYEARAKELRDKLNEYQISYYQTGRSTVSDIEYDRLYDELVVLEQDHPELRTSDSPTLRVGSDLSLDFPEVEHTIPVLSLDKAYSSNEIISFIHKTRKQTGDNLTFVLEEKIDGFSIVLYYKKGILERAVTRGNGFVGNDVTANVKTIKSVPLKITEPLDIAVRGEVFLPVRDFEIINASLSEPYANPRNLAAGTIRRNKSSETAKVPLSLFCYEGFWKDENPCSNHLQILAKLKKLGFPVDNKLSFFARTKEEAEAGLEAAGLTAFAGSFEDIEKDIAERTQTRSSLGYEIDGLVVKINELSVREDMGYTEHHPRWAIAYKFEAPQAETVVEAIDVQVGRTGRITPMARIRETELSGSVIRNITLHNQDYINNLELAVGDCVAISKRGDVIPAVERVTEKNNQGNTTWKMPETCPVCGSALMKSGAHHFCTEYNCPAQAKGRLEFFCSKKQMDIEGLGPSTIEMLYEMNYVRTIQELYCFPFERLISDGVEGFGELKVENIKQGLKQSKNQPFRRVLASLGISDLGKKSCELLCEAGYNSFDKIYALLEDPVKAEEKFTQIRGIGSVLAREYVEGFLDSGIRDLVSFLKENGFNTDEENTKQDIVTEKQIFSGETWCVTGTFENFKPRDKAMEEIVKRGGTEVTSVSSKTSCLLAGKNAGSKLEKARALGIKIVNEEEFLEIIGWEKQHTLEYV